MSYFCFDKILRYFEFEKIRQFIEQMTTPKERRFATFRLY